MLITLCTYYGNVIYAPEEHSVLLSSGSGALLRGTLQFVVYGLNFIVDGQNPAETHMSRCSVVA